MQAALDDFFDLAATDFAYLIVHDAAPAHNSQLDERKRLLASSVAAWLPGVYDQLFSGSARRWMGQAVSEFLPSARYRTTDQV